MNAARLIRVMAVALGLMLAPSAVAAPAQSGITQLRKAAGAHRLVAFGEIHWSAASHANIHAMLDDRRFICGFDDVVVEFGNSRLQRVADDYVAGKPVELARKREIWRGVGQLMSWDSPLYEGFFDHVRLLNQRRHCRHPLRVVLADPAIDWSRVKTADDYRQFANRSEAMADVLDREVLGRGRRGLFIAGVAHVLKRHAQEDRSGLNAVERVEAMHPGITYVILPVTNPRVASQLGIRANRPLELRSSVVSRKSYAVLANPGISVRVEENGQKVWKKATELIWPAIGLMADALVLQPTPSGDQVEPLPATYRDSAYVKELRRRAPILSEVFGFSFEQQLDDTIKALAN